VLKLNKIDLVSYASAFVSFILKPLKSFNIKEIILFGSVARGDFDNKSDIDLFINIGNEKESDKIKKVVNNELSKFYKSKINEIWINKGVTNKFVIKVGVLEKWKLKRSIIADGITLYGKYKPYPEKVEHYYLFAFEPIKDITKRNRIIRKLFGRKEGKFASQGFVNEINGERLSPTSFIIPISFSEKIFGIFKKEKIDYKIYEVWSDQFKK